MTNALYRLLDNRWIVSVMRQVDRNYVAFCCKPGEGLKGIFPRIRPIMDAEDNVVEFEEISPGKPNQYAAGVTPDEAIAALADKVFGLTATTRRSDGRPGFGNYD